ncbi:SDR family oxidoreductase [Mycobacterium sp. MAA66]|uniref:SDR family oxidoreductase n=1 Tax=Mycobacterium sp. MAA66 TaxID=3156297 RepID=UPI00351446EC
MPKRTILVTGPSGVVGRAIVAELSDHHVIGLLHDDDEGIAVNESIRGDIRTHRLGLDDRSWHSLADRVDIIIHSAALTTWGLSPASYTAVNVEGTQRVVDFAQRANAPIHLISSCFVHALERPDARWRPGNIVIPYVRSKWQAEQLVSAATVPSSVYRLTNVIGDSTTGASRRPQIVHQISQWICRGKAPYLPAHPGNRVDVIPLDIAARAISDAVRADDLGRLMWLSYGPQAMTLDAAQRIMVDHARGLGRDIGLVAVVNPDAPLPIPLEQIPRLSRQYLQVLIDVSEVTRACGGELPSTLAEFCGSHGISVIRDTDALRVTLRYWALKARYDGSPPEHRDDARPRSRTTV